MSLVLTLKNINYCTFSKNKTNLQKQKFIIITNYRNKIRKIIYWKEKNNNEVKYSEQFIRMQCS